MWLELNRTEIVGNLFGLKTYPSLKVGWHWLVGSKIICEMKGWGSIQTWHDCISLIPWGEKGKRSMQKAEIPSPLWQAIHQRTCDLKAEMDLATNPEMVWFPDCKSVTKGQKNQLHASRQMHFTQNWMSINSKPAAKVSVILANCPILWCKHFPFRTTAV